MPDYNEWAGLTTDFDKSFKTNTTEEYLLNVAAEKGLKASDLINDPLWGVFIKEVVLSIESAKTRLDSLTASLVSRGTPSDSIQPILRELDYAQATLDAYQSVVDCCTKLVHDGQIAKDSLISFENKD